MTYDRAFSIEDYITAMERIKKPGFWEITLTPRNLVSALMERYKIEKNLLS
jgi:hypothetical protein